jgi:hypothetical protein
MKKKIIFIIVYMVVCVTPFATLWFMKNDTSEQEKRELAAFPKLSVDGTPNTAFFTQFDDWFSDHLGFRSYLVSAQTALKEYAFGESAEPTVILGKNGWLFYEKTLDDYCHIATLSKRNADNVAYSMKLLQEYCNVQGADFVFTVAPNKNTLYADNMPGRYVRLSEDSNLTRLESSLARYNIPYADLKAAFMNDGRVLYQPRDSHWTYEGAMLAYRTIVAKLSSEHDIFQEITYTERRDWDADLVNMLYPGAADDDPQVYPNLEWSFVVKGDTVYDEALVIETIAGSGEGSLLMFRDSFGNTMWRYFAESFEKADFERAFPYRMSFVDRIGASAVVIEVVERNLINLAEKAPVMKAPKRDIQITDAYDMSGHPNCMKTGESAGLLHVYGAIDPEILGESYRVYLVVEDEEGKAFYEAFPILEKELLNEDETGDNGFSAYLPVELSGSLSGVLVWTDDKYYYQQFR